MGSVQKHHIEDKGKKEVYHRWLNTKQQEDLFQYRKLNRNMKKI